MLPFLTDAVVERLVDPLLLSEEIRDMLLDDGAVEADRSPVVAGGSWFAAMTAGDERIVSVKNVGVYPGNPARGLPLVRALTIVFSARTGAPLLVYEANAATGMRTAAASLLAARVLGAERGGVLGVIGAGVQALWHARVFSAALEPGEVLVYSRTRERAERLARLVGGRVAGLEEVNRRSSVLVAATTAREPVVRGDLLRRGAVVVSVGAPSPVRELDESVKWRARCLLVDTLRAVEESPDARGWERVVDLRDALRGAGCSPGGLRVYKSVGRPLFDLSVSRVLTRLLGLPSGLGSGDGPG